MADVDEQIALEAARDVMRLTYGPMPAGGSVQLQAMVQLRILEALAQQPAAPSAPVGVEWPLSLLRAGNWREVYVGHRCMRLEVTYEHAAWERLMEQVEAALAQQPAAVDGANARLIAAAPELLEALQIALSAIEQTTSEMTVGDRFTNAGQSLLDALNPCRDAISKATGAPA